VSCRQRCAELERLLAEAKSELERLATVDLDTGVLNHRGVADALARELEVMRRTGAVLSACLVHVDEIEVIRDELGLSAGDTVIAAVAERLGRALRITDSLGRVGSHELMLLLPHTRRAEAEVVADRARAAVTSDPISAGEGNVYANVSIAVETLPWSAGSFDEVVALMRSSLRRLRGSSDDFPPASSRRVDRIIGELTSGKSLRIVAQPIVATDDEHVIGYELFTRAREGLFEEPEQFLRLARDRGMLTAVDLKCLEACVAETRALPADSRVHVNLFPSTLLELPLCDIIDRLKPASHVRMCLELSEERLVGESSRLLERVTGLQNAGVSVAVDDVGRGRGSLDSVMWIEPDMVKIDGELIGGAGGDPRKQRLLRRMVRMADALGCQVVAEGVERRDDADLLQELGVAYAQGHLWSAAKPIQDVL
jgi:diguanylate cyclase (GGDEF)-like protein